MSKYVDDAGITRTYLEELAAAVAPHVLHGKLTMARVMHRQDDNEVSYPAIRILWEREPFHLVFWFDQGGAEELTPEEAAEGVKVELQKIFDNYVRVEAGAIVLQHGSISR